jgi:hypothetical protein
MKARIAMLAAALLPFSAAPAATVLIRDATVHTVSSAGVLTHTDILIRDGRIAELGKGLTAPADAQLIDAKGRPVTPGLFGGVGHVGIEEIGGEPSVDDYALKLGAMRPEFDVTPAFNPDSVMLGVSRLGGVTFAQLAPSSSGGPRGASGTIIAGQGGLVRLDGSVASARALFIETGGSANGLSGGTRAAQLMLLEQALTEVHSPKLMLPNDERLLTPAGRQALGQYFGGKGRVVFAVERASDIRHLIAFAEREHLRAAIIGGDEAWRVASELARADIPVIFSPVDDLPENFDAVGSTLENAALLNRAGVKIAFTANSQDPQDPHNVRVLRQSAGIAVAHGLPWDAALAALTRNAAEIFGVGDANGSLARGRPADLVLWSGDPLEVSTLADAVFIQGVAQPMRSRQTELRDRYLTKLRAHAAR